VRATQQGVHRFEHAVRRTRQVQSDTVQLRWGAQDIVQTYFYCNFSTRSRAKIHLRK
jgi:hypothetical protein